MRTREAWVLPRAGLADAGLEMSRQEEEVDGTTDKPSGEGQVTVLDYCCDVEGIVIHLELSVPASMSLSRKEKGEGSVQKLSCINKYLAS